MILKFKTWSGASFVFSDQYISLTHYFDATESKEQLIFINLKDKDDVEIYSGDIIECKKRQGERYGGVIEFCPEYGCFQLRHEGTIFENNPEATHASVLWAYGNNLKKCKVIGNIKSNPELLTKKGSQS